MLVIGTVTFTLPLLTASGAFAASLGATAACPVLSSQSGRLPRHIGHHAGSPVVVRGILVNEEAGGALTGGWHWCWAIGK